MQASPYSMLSPAAAAARQYSYAASVGGYPAASGVYRRSSYSSQIPHPGIPEDEPLSNFDAAGLSGGPVQLSRRASGRNGAEAASMPDPGRVGPPLQVSAVIAPMSPALPPDARECHSAVNSACPLTAQWSTLHQLSRRCSADHA